MRLEKRREEELKRRKGTAFKTVLGTIWLGLCFAAAYFFIGWLFETGQLTPGFFWTQLFIPTWVRPEALQVIAAIVVVVAMNFFVLLGYGFSSRGGRERPGTPSLKSRNPDPLDKKYY